MARLPQASDLRRRTAPASSPGIDAPVVDYAAGRAGINALGRGVESIGGALEFGAKQAEEDLDYETQKRLLDFKMETELALEEYKRTMPAGGSGYAAGWQSEYVKRAKTFVGKDDANVPGNLRGRVGMALKQHETALYERASREELAEKDRTEVEGLEQTLGVTRSFVEADPNRRDEMRAEGEAIIEKSRLSPAIKDATKRKFAKELDKTAIVTRIMKAQTLEDYQALEQDLAPEAPDRRVSSVVSDRVIGGKTGRPAGWAARNAMWQKLDPFQKAAAMSLLEADGANPNDARNALGAMINRAAKSGEDLGAHVSQAIYQPTIEPAQEARLSRVLLSPKFKELTEWAKRRVEGQEPDPVGGATHFLASEKTMLALEAGNPRKYRSWRKWTNFDGKEYRGVITRDNSHAFLAPDGEAETGPMEEEGTYGGPYANLTLTERRAYFEQAQAQRKKAVAELDKAVGEYEKNAVLGYSIPEPALTELGGKIAATGEEALIAKFNNTQVKAKVFSDFQRRAPSVNEMALQGIRQQFAQTPPTPDELESYKQIEDLVGKQRAMVDNDKLTWAYRSGAVQVGPLDFSSGESLKKRLDDAVVSTRQFGGPIQYFTKAERDEFAAKVKAGGDGLIDLTAKMTAAWGPEHTTRAIREVSDKVPEAAVAGYLLANNINPEAAKDISISLRRRQDPNYRPSMLPRSQTEPLAKDVLQDVFRNFPPQQRDAILGAADAVFEARVGKTTEDPTTVYTKAVQDVIGIRKDTNGKQYGGLASNKKTLFGNYTNDNTFLLPETWRNDTWKDVIEIASPRDLLAAGMLPPADARGKPLSMARIANGTLVQVGPGQYSVALGDPNTPGQEQWVMTAPMPRKARQPFVLDFNRLEKVMRPRVPGAFWQGD